MYGLRNMRIKSRSTLKIYTNILLIIMTRVTSTGCHPCYIYSVGFGVEILEKAPRD